MEAAPHLLSRRGALAAVMALVAARAAQAHGPQQVIIAKLVYAPAETTLHVGDTVTWVNNDLIARTATAAKNTPGGPWEVMLPPGKSAAMQMTAAGTIDYYCRFHPNMKARLIVLTK
jgi:plastocyanin